MCVTVHPLAELLLHPPIKSRLRRGGRMFASTTFSHGLRIHCANLPELLRITTIFNSSERRKFLAQKLLISTEDLADA